MPHLKRVLGQRDLALLCVVAIVNLNLVPVVAANGPVTIWLWLLALLLFFWPQGIAVIELSHRYPGEGGIYLWSKELFGEFQGFISGWCYWTNNIFYIPTLLFYLVGISVYVGGERTLALGDNRAFVFSASLIMLVAMVALNVRGLGVGKWVNNLGGIGTAIAALVLIGLAAYVLGDQGSGLAPGSFRPAHADWQMVSSFGVICFGLVGLELGSIMGDEIREPRRTIPRAIFWGGVVSGVLYIGATLAVLLALPQEQIGVVQGILQAVSKMASEAGVSKIVPVLAVVLSVSIAGATSAWLAGSARIPFVAGLDRYLPSALGKLHQRYATPYVALITHATCSFLFVALSFVGASVEEAYKTMLDLAIVLQLVPFLYMYAALVKLAAREQTASGSYKRSTLWVAGVSGFLTTALGMALAFLPSRHIASVWLFELKMALGCLFFLGLAAFFFKVYSGRTTHADWSNGSAEPGVPGE